MRWSEGEIPEDALGCERGDQKVIEGVPLVHEHLEILTVGRVKGHLDGDLLARGGTRRCGGVVGKRRSRASHATSGLDRECGKHPRWKTGCQPSRRETNSVG